MKKYILLILVVIGWYKAGAQSKKWFFEKGIYISTPAHDDMWRTHRIGTGADWYAGYQRSKKTTFGIRLTYDYYWERKHFPARYKIPDAAKKAFTVASLRAGIQHQKNKKWFYGIETGSGILHTCGATRIGLGWVEEYDGWTKYALVSSIYFGRNVYIKFKKTGNLTLAWTHVYAERHAENFAGIRLNINTQW